MAENDRLQSEATPEELAPDAAISFEPNIDSADTGDAATEAALRRRPKRKRGRCYVSGVDIPVKELFPIAMLRPALVERLRSDIPDLPPDAQISVKELNRLRGTYVEEILKKERGEVSDLEREVIESLERHQTLTEDTEREYEEHRTLGERLADAVADFGGSWTFIISFGSFVLVWMGINLWLGSSVAFDVYPFILLNLVLSCIAAIQAPVIMMSQKRQDSKDRMRSENDYQVNLKAELEIRHLHEKVDHLLKKQWERLAEIQEIQIELLQELVQRKRSAAVKKAMKAPRSDAGPPSL